MWLGSSDLPTKLSIAFPTMFGFMWLRNTTAGLHKFGNKYKSADKAVNERASEEDLPF